MTARDKDRRTTPAYLVNLPLLLQRFDGRRQPHQIPLERAQVVRVRGALCAELRLEPRLVHTERLVVRSQRGALRTEEREVV